MVNPPNEPMTQPQRPALRLDDETRWVLQQLAENANSNGESAVCELYDALMAGWDVAAKDANDFVSYATGVCDALRWLAGDGASLELTKSLAEPKEHVHP